MYNIWNYLLLARRMAVISAPVKLVKLLKQCLKAQIQKNVAPICPPGPVRISVRCKLESWCHLSERGVVPGEGRGRRSVPDGHRGDARQGLGAWRPLASTQSERSCLLSALSSSRPSQIPGANRYLRPKHPIIQFPIPYLNSWFQVRLRMYQKVD